MTTVRTLATHEVVRVVFPRPVTERDELGMAVGKAIDGALSQYSHAVREGRRPTVTATHRAAESILDEELADADLRPDRPQRAQLLAEIAGVVGAFRRSELVGLPRPRSRLILVGERVGVYAQPDYWNGRDRFYEMKSFHASPVPSDVQLQIRLFQLAFPNFRAFLAAFDRHANPVTTTIVELPALPAEVVTATLKQALRAAAEVGTDKVLEYIDRPIVRYPFPA